MDSDDESYGFEAPPPARVWQPEPRAPGRAPQEGAVDAGGGHEFEGADVTGLMAAAGTPDSALRRQASVVRNR